jgi:hypothetical protein
VESVYNVFKSNIEKQPQPEEKAVELQVDPTEEKVEFVMSLPEFDEYSAEPIKMPEHIPMQHSALLPRIFYIHKSVPVAIDYLQQRGVLKGNSIAGDTLLFAVPAGSRTREYRQQ